MSIFFFSQYYFRFDHCEVYTATARRSHICFFFIFFIYRWIPNEMLIILNRIKKKSVTFSIFLGNNARWPASQLSVCIRINWYCQLVFSLCFVYLTLLFLHDVNDVVKNHNHYTDIYHHGMARKRIGCNWPNSNCSKNPFVHSVLVLV